MTRQFEGHLFDVSFMEPDNYLMTDENVVTKTL